MDTPADEHAAPARQATQPTAPGLGAYDPAAQFRHTADVLAPVAVLYFPAAHGVLADMPVKPQNPPVGHGAQTEYPLVGEYVPALQAVATDKPVTPHADPAGHGAQMAYPLVGA